MNYKQMVEGLEKVAFFPDDYPDDKNPWLNDGAFHLNDGTFFMGTDNEGRDQTLVVGIKSDIDDDDIDDDDIDDIDDIDLFKLAYHLYYDEDWGFVDMDGITVEIQIGNNFHGIDDEVLETLDIEDFTYEEINFFWVKIHWSDTAS